MMLVDQAVEATTILKHTESTRERMYEKIIFFVALSMGITLYDRKSSQFRKTNDIAENLSTPIHSNPRLLIYNSSAHVFIIVH